jgi:ABC-type nitrate/sulfonate/bicarbonate transport system substrate-binding protein
MEAALAPIWLGIDDGYFQAQGVVVEFHSLPGLQTPQALVASEVDLGVAGLAAIAAYAAGERDLVHVAGLFNGAPGAPLWKLYGVPGLTTVKELRGRRIAVTSYASTSYVAARLILPRFGIDADREAQMVQLRDGDTVLASLASGSVDAGLLPPEAGEHARALGLPQLADTENPRVPLLGVNLVTRRSWAGAHTATLEAVLRGYLQSIAATRASPERALQAYRRWAHVDDLSMVERVRGQLPGITPELPLEAIKVTLENLPPTAGLGIEATELVDARYLHAAQLATRGSRR